MKKHLSFIKEVDRKRKEYPIAHDEQIVAMVLESKSIYRSPAYDWVKYSFSEPPKRPPEYGRYLVCRKDGKTHLETWNGNGWAYNEKAIVYWAKINSPLK